MSKLPRMADLMAQLRAAVEEFGDATPINKLPTNTQLVDPSGYTATKPGPIGAAHTAVVFHVDEHGIAFGSLVVKDGTPDLHRTEQIRMYGRKKRTIQETATFPAVSTDDLKDNPNEAADFHDD